jgi:hypothetical protein
MQLAIILFLRPFVDVISRTIASMASLLFTFVGYRLPGWMLRFHPGIFHENREFGWEKGMSDIALEKRSRASVVDRGLRGSLV